MTASEVISSSRAPRRTIVIVADWLSRYAAFSAILMALLIAAIFAPHFFDPGNIRAVGIQTAVLGIVVLGQTAVLLARGIDISVSAVVTFAAVLAGRSAASGDLALLVLQLTLLVGGVGLANALLITRRGVPPFVATFAMLVVVDGVRLAYTRGQSANSAPAWLVEVGTGSLLGVPLPILLWLLLLAACALTFTRTAWGRWLYAVGSNGAAARHVGIPVDLVVASTYFLTAATATIAGLLQAGYVGYIDNTLGSNHGINSVAAAIIGGVAFTGGRGGVIGAAVGALLLTILGNLLVVMGFSLFWQRILQGAVLVLAVVIQGIRSTER